MPTQVVNPSHGKVMDALNRHTWDFCVWTRERKRLSSSTISSAIESQPLLPGEDEVGSEESDTLPGSVTTRGKLCESDRRHKYHVSHANRSHRDRRTYLRDLFHTPLNLPASRFLVIFVASYLTLYTSFALVYMLQSVSKHCVSNITSFKHALWFSVHTSATIGYGHQSPNPDCTVVNIAIMAEVLMTSLLQATMVGLVFARFSVASSRASTILWSTRMVTRGDTISIRLGNLRNHQLLRPRVTLFMVYKARSDDGDDPGVEFRSEELKLASRPLWLGIPAVITHKVDRFSPLRSYWSDGDPATTAACLAEADVEFVCLLDGVDETTSKDIQARHSWLGEDIRFEHVFKRMTTRRGGDGALVVDWRLFHSVRPVEGQRV